MKPTSYDVLTKAAPIVVSAIVAGSGYRCVFNPNATPCVVPDEKTMYLPTPPTTFIDDTTKHKYFGFVHHECAHIQYTEFGAAKILDAYPQVVFHIFNIFEDGRIENLAGQRSSYVKNSLKNMVSTLVDEDFFSEPPIDASEVNSFLAYLLYKMRSFHLKQDSLCQYSDIAEALTLAYFGPHVLNQLSDLLERPFKSNATTSEMVQAAIEAYDFLKQIANDTPNQSQSSSSNSDSSDQDQSSEPNSQSSDSNSENTDSQSSPESKHSNDDDSSNDTQTSNGQTNSSSSANENQDDNQSSQGASKPSIDDSKYRQSVENLLKATESEIDKHLDDLSDSLQDDINTISSQSGSKLSTEFEEFKPIGRVNQALITDAKKSTARTISQLKPLLMSRKKRFSRKKSAGSLLDERSLDRLSMRDPRIFKSKNYQKALNTKVTLLLDKSGSMSSRNYLASLSTLAIALTLDEISNVSVQCATFYNSKDVSVIKPLNKQAKHVSSNFLESPSGGTPMELSLYWAIKNLITDRADRNIVIVITDGDPNSKSATESSISLLEQSNVETWAIGINSERVKNLFSNYELVNQPSDLAKAIVNLFKRGFTQAYR